MSRSRATMVALVAAASLAMPAAARGQTAPATYAELDRGVHALVVKVAVKPDRTADFLRLMQARVEEGRRDPAVVDFRVFATADPAIFYAFESYRDRAGFDAFRRSPESVAFAARLKEVVARPVEAQVLKPLP